MEVRQRMKFTGTNSSIGLIVLILNAHRSAMLVIAHACSARWAALRGRGASAPTGPVGLAKLRFVGRWQTAQNSFSNDMRFADLVVMAERLHPIPFRTRP